MEYLTEYLLTTDEDDSHSGNLMPSSFDYLDDTMLLPHVFNLIDSNMEKSVLQALVRKFV